MQIEMMPVGSITPYEKNPRKNKQSVDAVAESIKEFGFKVPIIIDKDGVIVAGHTRLMAAKKLKMTEVPIIRADDLTPEQIKAFRLADNKVGESSEWDFDLLKEELDGIFDIDMSAFGFDFEELPAEAVDDDYEVEPPKDPKSKRGDIYILGNHRVMCGDSTDVEDVRKLLGGVQADLYLTDPPYNVDYVGKTKDALKIENDKKDDAEFRTFLDEAFLAAQANMKAGAVFYIWHADSEGYNFRGACHDIGWVVRECLIWVKNSMVLGRQDYQWQHEPCQPAGTIVLTTEGEKPIEQLKDGDRVISFDTYSGQVLGFRNTGYEIKTAQRHYKGTLYGIKADGRQTWATNNHEFSVRFNARNKNNYCTYLMRRGDWWRVGLTKAYDARQFGLKTRMHQELGEECWLISTHQNKIEAQVMEQILTCKYGIPYTVWEPYAAARKSQRTPEQVEKIYAALDLEELRENAIRLLHDFHRDENYPLITAAVQHVKFSTRVTAKINACNLVPGLMEVPVLTCENGIHGFKWAAIEEVEHRDHDDTVYSLAVDEYQHYVADGIITHNCLYGWNSGSHAWYSDRKQTTLLHFDRPTRSGEHPTMKPIPLFDYLIKNSSKEGDIVLDSFGGSGTTIMACEQNGRRGYCMEIDPRYVDVIVDRWETYTGKKAVRVDG